MENKVESVVDVFYKTNKQQKLNFGKTMELILFINVNKE